MTADQGRTLPPFPIDDQALTLLLSALDTALDIDERGTRTVVGGEFTLNRLLDFYSGYDPSRSVLIDADFDSFMGRTELWEHPDEVYAREDVIRALVHEIQRLRQGGTS